MAGPLAVAKIERPIEMLPEDALHTEEKKKIQESEKHSKKENSQQTVKDLQEQENTQSDQTDHTNDELKKVIINYYYKEHIEYVFYLLPDYVGILPVSSPVSPGL